MTRSLPVLLVGAFAPETISIIENLPSREERALKLEDESSKKFRRFTDHLQDKISHNITADEVETVIQSGFDSGEFCKDLPTLASPNAIRSYAYAILKAKYKR